MKVIIKEMKEDEELYAEALMQVQTGSIGALTKPAKGNFFKNSFNLSTKKKETGGPVVSSNVRVKLGEEESEESDHDQQAEDEHQQEMRKTR